MPRISAWSLRAALLWLLAGFSLGGLLLANKGIPFSATIWQMLGPHVEIVLMGWMVQLAMSVAFWILPRYPGGSRGNEKIAGGALLLLNLGVLLVCGQAFNPLWLAAGRVCEVLAGGLFGVHAWGRVRPLYPPNKPATLGHQTGA